MRNVLLLTLTFAALLTAPKQSPGQNTQAAEPQYCLSDGNVLSPIGEKPTCIRPVEGSRVHSPRLIHSTDSKFPHGDRIYGTCIISIVVGEDGKPTDITVKRSLRPDYDEKAIEAVRKFRFSPAMLDGKAVSKHIDIEQNFVFQ